MEPMCNSLAPPMSQPVSNPAEIKAGESRRESRDTWHQEAKLVYRKQRPLLPHLVPRDGRVQIYELGSDSGHMSFGILLNCFDLWLYLSLKTYAGSWEFQWLQLQKCIRRASIHRVSACVTKGCLARARTARRPLTFTGAASAMRKGCWLRFMMQRKLMETGSESQKRFFEFFHARNKYNPLLVCPSSFLLFPVRLKSSCAQLRHVL